MTARKGATKNGEVPTPEAPEAPAEETVVEGPIAFPGEPPMTLTLAPNVVRVLRDAFTKVADGVPVTIVLGQ